MTDKITILSIDLGKTCGVAVVTEQGLEFSEDYNFKTLLQLQTYTKGLLSLWRPDVVLIPYPTRFYRVILAHAKMMGVIEAAAEYRDTLVIEVQDSTCKKVVIGKGNAKKEDIAEHYKDKYPDLSEHQKDAVMFVEWYLKSV